MPSLDIFNDDAFSVQSLTKAINTVPEGQQVPTMLDGLFTEEGVTTTSVSIEMEDGELFLVPDQPRGAPGQITVGDKRLLIPFNTLHLPTTGKVRADEVQNIRAFGSETEVQTVEALVNKLLQKMRRKLDATLAYHRVGAVTGIILDADGKKVLLNLFDRFGLQPQVQAMALGTDATDVAQKIRDAQRKSEDVLAGTSMITGWLGIAGRGFYDAFVGHKSVKDAFNRWNDGQFLRDDMRKGFTYQDVVWKEFYGKVGGVSFIDKDEAYLVPITTEDIFSTTFAPADYMETVNTLGLPYYAAQERMDFNKGVMLEAQTNPLTICTRPRAIIKLKKT